MFVVDTNILVFAANRDSPGHTRCRELLAKWRAMPSPWYLTWGIVYEFARVVTHPRVFSRPFSLDQALAFVQSLLASPNLVVLVETDRHRAVLMELAREFPAVRGNLMFDLHAVALMKEHGIRTIYTHDADFHRFPFLTVVDPLQSAD